MSAKQTSPSADGDAVEDVEETVSDAVEETDAVEESDTALADDAAVEPSVAEPRPGAVSRALSWCRRRWLAVLLTVLLVASAGAAGGVYWWIYRPDQQTNAAAQQRATDAARDGTVALLSYAPETLDKDLTNAKSHLTGEFLKYYSQFTDQIVAPAAKQKGVKTEATVTRAAVSQMQPDRAVVLVFVNQVTTSKDRPDPALATSSVMVTLVKQDGRWLISEFNPV
jgi:Mce-associated membrane protein